MRCVLQVCETMRFLSSISYVRTPVSGHSLVRGYPSKSRNIVKIKLQINFPMGDKSVETLGSKIRFPSTLLPQTMLIILFIRQHRRQRLNSIELGGGIRKLTLLANKEEQVFQYRESHFLKASQLLFSPIALYRSSLFMTISPNTVGPSCQKADDK